jgi:hypothetical protein
MLPQSLAVKVFCRLADEVSMTDSSRVARERLLAQFENHVLRTRFAGSRDRVADPDFWRAICPGLTISDRPFTRPLDPYAIAPEVVARCQATLDHDGYFATDPVTLPASADRLIDGARLLTEAGFPSGFAVLFDEFWRLFDGLEPLLAPMLGDDYQLVPDGLWLFLVPLGHPGGSYHAASAPHRDAIGPDPLLMDEGRASLLNIWIALTDATPLNSCIYLLPASVDDDYRSANRDAPAHVCLPDIRAVPVPAGTVMGWTSHLLHWGSRSSPRGGHTRASAALSAQRRDRPSFTRTPIERGGELPFDRRLAFMLDSLSWE